MYMKNCVLAVGVSQPKWWRLWTLEERRVKLALRRENGGYEPQRGYKPHKDRKQSASSWNFTQQWLEPLTQDDPPDVHSSSSWNFDQQWLEPVTQDDPPDVQEGGDQPSPEPATQQVYTAWTFAGGDEFGGYTAWTEWLWSPVLCLDWCVLRPQEGTVERL